MTASTYFSSCSTWSVSRARSSASASPSASSRSAVIGVRRRCERSATSSRSAARSSPMRAPSRLRTRPTDAISRGPSGVTLAPRSPAASRSATCASSRTERAIRAAIRSAASTAPTSSTAPTRPSVSRAACSPWCSRDHGTSVRTTTTPPGPPTGNRTSRPAGTSAVKACPAAANSTLSPRTVGTPIVRPSGRNTVVCRRLPALTESTTACRRSSSATAATTPTLCVSCRARPSARSSASDLASRPRGMRKARTTTDVIAAPYRASRRLIPGGPGV